MPKRFPSALAFPLKLRESFKKENPLFVHTAQCQHLKTRAMKTEKRVLHDVETPRLLR